MDLEVLGLSAALGSAASWAVGSILFKRLGEYLTPMAMTLAKGLVSLVLLALALVATESPAVDQETLWLLILSGVLGIALGDTFFFAALNHLGAHALVVLLTLGQVFTVGLAVIWLGERPTWSAYVGIVLILTGVGLVLVDRMKDEAGNSSTTGILFGLLSVLCMSVSIIIAKEALDQTSAIHATFVRMVAGTLGILLFGLATRQLAGDLAPFADPRLALRFVLSVCVVTFGGFWLSLVAIQYADVAIASTLGSTEPLFVLPLAAYFLKERIGAQAVAGSIATVAGIALLVIYS